jgi:GNAT superfamily N-acetyltransferase
MEPLAFPRSVPGKNPHVVPFSNAFRVGDAPGHEFGIEAWHGPRLSMSQLAMIGELIHQVWPKDRVTAEDRAVQLADMVEASRRDTGRAAPIFVVREGAHLIAQAIVLPRLVNWAGFDMLVGGLSRVCTHPSARGRGLGEAVVRAAMSLADGHAVACLLFQTSLKVRPFYLRLGAADVTNRVINSRSDDPLARPFEDEVVMRYPACNFANGIVDLRGPGY